jgi:6,7-dimethyl-8-ribityllumazine synthase
MQIKTDTSTIETIKKARVAIVHSEYYRDHITRMVEPCQRILAGAGCEKIDCYSVPGCVELPLAARRVARLGIDYEAIVCFGIIIKGDTYHFDIVMKMTTEGLFQVMMEEDIPIIVEILPADDIKIIDERTAPNDRNKGIEAGVTASKVIAWRRRHQGCLPE